MWGAHPLPHTQAPHPTMRMYHIATHLGLNLHVQAHALRGGGAKAWDVNDGDDGLVGQHPLIQDAKLLPQLGLVDCSRGRRARGFILKLGAQPGVDMLLLFSGQL